MTAFVDVRFRGLRVAHKAKLVESEGGAFVEHETPLPVGSPLSVVEEGKEDRLARVVHVVEHEAGAGAPGMQLVWDSGAVLREAITIRVEKPPVVAEESAASAAPEASSADVSSDASGDASTDGSSDGTVEAPVLNGNSSGKKSKKNKKRR